MVADAGAGAGLILGSGVVGILFAMFQLYCVSLITLQPKQDSSALLDGERDDKEMMGMLVKIYKVVTEGAKAFLYAEYKVCAVFIVVFGAIVMVAVAQSTDGLDWALGGFSALSFAIGAVTSIVSGYIGMMVAVYSNARTAREAMLAAPKLKIKETDVHLDGEARLKVYAGGRSGRSEATGGHVFELQRLQRALMQVVVAGIREISRAIISRKEEGEKHEEERGRECFQLLVEGVGLQAVMGVKGLRGETARTTHVMEVEKVLGIEAARRTTMDEVQFTMRSHGMDIDDRHVTLLADVMTFRGEVLGITRFGVPKMKQSVLMLASFEKTSDHLYDAAVHARTDAIAGVSECIITGVPMPVGTGIFKLLQRVPRVPLPTGAPLLIQRGRR